MPIRLTDSIVSVYTPPFVLAGMVKNRTLFGGSAQARELLRRVGGTAGGGDGGPTPAGEGKMDGGGGGGKGGSSAGECWHACYPSVGCVDVIVADPWLSHHWAISLCSVFRPMPPVLALSTRRYVCLLPRDLSLLRIPPSLQTSPPSLFVRRCGSCYSALRTNIWGSSTSTCPARFRRGALLCPFNPACTSLVLATLFLAV